MVSRFDVYSESIVRKEDGLWVDADDYDELKDLAVKMYDWCVSNGKKFSEKDKHVASAHGLLGGI